MEFSLSVNMALKKVTSRLTYKELDQLYATFDLATKLNDGRLHLSYARTTSFGGTIDRVLTASGIQVATIHRLYDVAGEVAATYPESIVVGEVVLFRIGHD